MLVVTGFFDKETFYPDSPVSIPQNKKVVVTIEEEKAEMSWREICNAIQTCDEEIPSEPQPINFRTIEEMDAL
jgi:hypothetical protein